MLTTLANQAAMAFENARLFQETEQYTKKINRLLDHQTVINAMGLRLGGTLDFAAICQIAQEEIQKLVDCPNFAVFLYDSQLQRITPLYILGDGNPIDIGSLPPIPLEPGTGPQSRAIESGAPDIVDDLLGQLGEIQTHINIPTEKRQQTRSILTVPMLIEKQVMGTVQLQSYQVAAYKREDADLLSGIANQIALAIQNSLLFKSVEKKRLEAETLRKSGTFLSSSLNLQKTISTILDEFSKVIQFDSMGIFARYEDHQQLISGRGYPDPDQLIGEKFPIGDDFTEEIRRTKHPLVVADVQEEPRFQVWGNVDYIRGWMLIPLIARDTLIGHISVDSRHPNIYTEDDANLGLAFANQAAIALENARLYESAQQHSTNLEKRVSERTEELQQLVNLMAGREVRMAELKKVIKKLRAQLMSAGMKPEANDPLLEEF